MHNPPFPSPVLDGLPRDWPDHTTHPQKDPTTSPFNKNPPSPTTTAFTQPSDAASPPQTTSKSAEAPPQASLPEVIMQPLPDALVPEDVQDPTCLVADVFPPLQPSSKVESELDDPGVKDLGWSNNSMPATSLIRGTTNDELFMLIRRFNKVCHSYAITLPSRSHLQTASTTRQGPSTTTSRLPRPRDRRRRGVFS